MHLNTCFALLLMGLAIIQAFPAENLEKSLEAENLELEDVSDDKDRLKKSTICVNIKEQPQMQTVNMVPQSQTLSIQQAPVAFETLSIQNAPAPVQTLSIQNGPEAVQTLSFQSAAPGVQTFSIASAPAPLQTLSIQPVAPVTQGFNFQSQDTAISQTTLARNSPNTVQPAVPQASASAVEAAPVEQLEVEKPAPVVETNSRSSKIVDQPERIVLHQVEEEDVVNVEPSAPLYNKQIVVSPVRPLMMVAEAEPVAAAVHVPHCNCCESKCIHSNYAAVRSGVMMEPFLVKQPALWKPAPKRGFYAGVRHIA
ncbi:hypothetical protein WH47_12209 [Habropoda laboriosa]|uniref:Uncharacterized protein n=1 Tax=Habropoda laboriosa TaxID=597456 RepID=A0A0L7RAK6_9HYME|nr:hypothetical protein WH47_12209 [Habropoda laboriosa]